MIANIANIVYKTKKSKFLFYICTDNKLNNNFNLVDMNIKCTINPKLINKYNFKYLFTYRLLYHIMVYFNIDSKAITLNKVELIITYNSNYRAVNNAIDELLYYGIIYKYVYDKYKYIVNTNIFIDFTKDNIK